MATPLPNLTAAMLRHAHAILTGDMPVIEVVFTVDGTHVHVTLRDLLFIHQHDASRFGRYADCPICKEEVAA